MKKLVLALALVTMAFSGAALAQTEVGVYFDDSATRTYLGITEISQHHAYIVMTGLGETALVGGFELALLVDQPLMTFNFTFPAGSGAINLQTEPTFLTGFAEALPAVGGAFTVLEFDVLATTANAANWNFYEHNPSDDYDDAYEALITPKAIFFNSIEDEFGDPVMAYLDGAGEILPMTPGVGEYRGYAATVVELIVGPVATDEASWDEVKSLYR